MAGATSSGSFLVGLGTRIYTAGIRTRFLNKVKFVKLIFGYDGSTNSYVVNRYTKFEKCEKPFEK